MNLGTSQVNWNEITDHKIKIAEYKKRMLNQNPGFASTPNQHKGSVQQKSYVPYGSDVLGRDTDAATNKARNMTVGIGMAHNKRNPTETTENRQSFQRYENGQKADTKEMVEKLKATNFKMGFLNRQSNLPSPTRQNMQVQANKTMGETSKMYSYVQQRGQSSTVLPSNANAGQFKQSVTQLSPNNKSLNSTTFKWNSFRVQ